MKVFNTLTRRLEEFVPLEPGHVRMYTCGPTVYDYAHIGNFRAYAFEDLLRRYLKYRGYRVTQVMNLTDVDDKTIRRSRETEQSLDAYTAVYKQAFFEDVQRLGIERAEHYPAATAHIPAMIRLIERLLASGHAYASDDGSVYFSIAKFPAYGKLAHLDMAGMRPGARVAQDEYEKENVADFALWKAWDETDGAVAWDSPWGRGRPGWHIECSAMAMQYLGETFDIHTGGIDNMFPHHEDEIAQAEAATGKPFVRYWMHCAHLVVDGQKMAKRLGNFHTLRDLLGRGYTGRELRYVLISAQYRQSLNFTFEALDAARVSLKRMDDFLARLRERGGASTPAGALPAWAERAKAGFEAAMDNDLNTPEAFAAVFNMIHDGNRALDAGQDLGAAGAVLELVARFDTVLGVLAPAEAEVPAEIRALADARVAARATKQWAESDRLRDRIKELGWEARDTPAGQKLRKL